MTADLMSSAHRQALWNTPHNRLPVFQDGMPPLGLAALKHHLPAARALLEAGASVSSIPQVCAYWAGLC